MQYFISKHYNVFTVRILQLGIMLHALLKSEKPKLPFKSKRNIEIKYDNNHSLNFQSSIGNLGLLRFIAWILAYM